VRQIADLALRALEAPSLLLVSPHLDDAVLSAGGLIAERADRGVLTTVLTVLAGPPAEGQWSGFAAKLHAECGLASHPVRRRRAEDRRALAGLGAVPLHGTLLDAVYRRSAGGWLYESDDALFGPTAPGDAVAAQARDAVAAACLRLRPDLIAGPRAIGGHVDHVAVSDAVQAAGRCLGLPAWLWEDQPYAALDPGPPAGPAGQPIDLAGAIEVRISPRSWQRKLTAVSRYRSQVRMLFAPGEWPGAALTRYATSAGRGGPIERYWPAGPAPAIPVMAASGDISTRNDTGPAYDRRREIARYDEK
jgi:LmbE family N-acetylglucosaminyl deacetylase